MIHIFGPVTRWTITTNRPGVQITGTNNYKNNTLKVQTKFFGQASVFTSDLLKDGNLGIYTKRSKVYIVKNNISITTGSMILPDTQLHKNTPSKPISRVVPFEDDLTKEHCTMINFSSVQRKYVGWWRANKRLKWKRIPLSKPLGVQFEVVIISPNFTQAN